MVFNSLEFLIFFIIFLCAYSFVGSRSLRVQNTLLLIGSYYFYAYWDYRFLILILISTVIDFEIGRKVFTSKPGSKKKWLWASVVANLSLLGTFKYFNFFADSFVDVLNIMGMHASYTTLKVVLPIGISFYTFQSMSYTIDIYRGKLEPCSSRLDYAVFVAFFPQLVAGPIERAKSLLPQIQRPRQVLKSDIHEGFYLVLWGLFKKIYIADHLALIVDPYFNEDLGVLSGLDLWIILLAFAFQIYCDFSGYTNVARGLAKFLGFNLKLNFNLPYMARTPSEFWKRWHISLSSWLKEYLYFSLGGSRTGRLKTYRNLCLTMLLGGLWHGAAWNFVLWGAYHALILMLWHYYEERFGTIKKWKPAASVLSMGVMFFFTLLGWLCFRATSGTQILEFGILMFSDLHISPDTFYLLSTVVEFSWFLIIVQAVQFRSGDLMWLIKRSRYQLTFLYLFLGMCILQRLASPPQEFIYFQF
jgi:alginate O-acetyltransferase complex protein AlgI